MPKPEPLKLKSHPDFDEQWLQKLIAEDTTILGLGELELIARERRQDHGGRLDLLLADPEGVAEDLAVGILGQKDQDRFLAATALGQVMTPDGTLS